MDLVAQEATRRMLKLGKGSIFFTGASASKKGFAKSSAFAMGKFGLRGLAQSLARELQPRNIHIAHFIIDGIINGNEITINANIMNEGYIDNLPSNCCVEVPCLINANGFMPQKIGKLPEQLIALMRTNINVQILTAEAALTKKKEHIYHAAMLDPLTGANLTIDEIYDMTDKLIEAHGNYLPQYN